MELRGSLLLVATGCKLPDREDCGQQRAANV
jgi:hypothetical protein